MKAQTISEKQTKLIVDVNLDKALGAAHRSQYLEENPHGFKKTNHVHKNKKKYSRKPKHRSKFWD